MKDEKSSRNRKASGTHFEGSFRAYADAEGARLCDSVALTKRPICFPDHTYNHPARYVKSSWHIESYYLIKINKSDSVVELKYLVGYIVIPCLHTCCGRTSCRMTTRLGSSAPSARCDILSTGAIHLQRVHSKH